MKKPFARYAGLTDSPDESGRRRRERGLARAGNARVNFAAFFGRSPDTATFEAVRRYQLHLAASGVGVPTINQTVSTLRFFFDL